MDKEDSDPEIDKSREADKPREADEPRTDDVSASAEVVRVDFGAKTKKQKPSTPSGLNAGELSPAVARFNEAKLELFSSMVDRGLVMVTVDASAEGVVVPPPYASEQQFALNFSHRFGLDDFSYDLHGVRASLSFGGDDFFCDVPWSAVWMMRSGVDGEMALSPESVPAELRAALAQASAELEAEAKKGDDTVRGPTNIVAALASVTSREGASVVASKHDGDKSETHKDSSHDDDDPPPTSGLRLIKG